MYVQNLSGPEIFSRLNKRAEVIRDTGKLPSADKFYLSFIPEYEGVEITPDIIVFGYEEALKENLYIEHNFPEIGKAVWVFGKTGQDDQWFLLKEKEEVLYYDHNKGQYQSISDFLHFNITFRKFMQIAFLYRNLETRLDETNDNLAEDEKKDFAATVGEIDSSFYDNYPFQYF